MNVFKIDGVAYNHLIVTGLTENFQVLDSSNTKRTTSGVMNRKMVGTYFNYTVTVSPMMNEEGMKEFNRVIAICALGNAFHTITMPLDVPVSSTEVTQNWIQFEAYITSGNRSISVYGNGINYWDKLELNFVARRPFDSSQVVNSI